jgi:phage tail protein X
MLIGVFGFLADVLTKYGMNIRIGRTVFALLVALSVATLPAAGGFAAGSKTLEASVSETMPDCGHHRHNTPSDKTQKTTEDNACMGACAVACFGFMPTAFSDIAFSSPISIAPRLIRTSDSVPSQLANLPFRPPRA